MNQEESHQQIRAAVRDLCSNFPGEYWRRLDEARAYPEEFVKALTDAGWLAALIPEEFGGAGLGITEASIILEEVNHSGANSGACHAQMYIMGTLLRHGSAEQKRSYLPEIAAGKLRLQSFAVTEPTTGSDTTRLKTLAVRKGDRYVVNGQKVWTSRVQHSDLMLLLARTTPLDQVQKKSEGLSVFLIDLRSAPAGAITVRPIRNMPNHETNEVFFDNLEIPADTLIGEEGKGFRYILDGMNAERILIAGECIGDGHWFIERATAYAKERVVFDRPIGQNQGVQFPLSPRPCECRGRRPDAVQGGRPVRGRAALRRGSQHGQDAGGGCVLEAANVCLQTHGGFGFAAEYDVERSSARRGCTRWPRYRPISFWRISASTCLDCRDRTEVWHSPVPISRAAAGVL